MTDDPRAELIVTSACNRILGITNRSSLTAEGEEDDPKELAVMQALRNMLDDLDRKDKEAEAQRLRSQTPLQPPPSAQWAPPVAQMQQGIAVPPATAAAASMEETPATQTFDIAPSQPVPTENSPTDTRAEFPTLNVAYSASTIRESQAAQDTAAERLSSSPAVDESLDRETRAMDAGPPELKKVRV